MYRLLDYFFKQMNGLLGKIILIIGSCGLILKIRLKHIIKLSIPSVKRKLKNKNQL